MTQCDFSLGKTVKISFSGVENPNLPGLLALGAGSQASGIGIETPQGKPLPVNLSGTEFTLTQGRTRYGY